MQYNQNVEFFNVKLVVSKVTARL